MDDMRIFLECPILIYNFYFFLEKTIQIKKFKSYVKNHPTTLHRINKPTEKQVRCKLKEISRNNKLSLQLEKKNFLLIKLNINKQKPF